MFKQFKILFLLIPIISFSQEMNITTKFIKGGDLKESLSGYSQRFTQFRKGEKCIVIEYLGRNNYKVRYKKWIGFVRSEHLLVNDEMKKNVERFEEEEKREIEENKKVRELEVQEMLRREKEKKNQRIKKEDSILKVKIESRIENERLELIEYRKICHYEINEIDDFDKVKIIRTSKYWISNNLYVELYKKGNSKYVFFSLLNDIGCASPYKNDRSFVKVKLENNDIIAFYHSWDVDCSDFNLRADLTQLQISRLKKSPIKSIRLQGTDYYFDISEFDYREFFIDKLKCLD